MRHEHVVDLDQLFDRQVAHAGAGVEENIFIDQHAGGTQIPTDAATTAQNLYFHRFFAPSRPGRSEMFGPL